MLDPFSNFQRMPKGNPILNPYAVLVLKTTNQFSIHHSVAKMLSYFILSLHCLLCHAHYEFQNRDLTPTPKGSITRGWFLSRLR